MPGPFLTKLPDSHGGIAHNSPWRQGIGTLETCKRICAVAQQGEAPCTSAHFFRGISEPVWRLLKIALSLACSTSNTLALSQSAIFKEKRECKRKGGCHGAQSHGAMMNLQVRYAQQTMRPGEALHCFLRSIDNCAHLIVGNMAHN